ncbi:MAG: hypothetical protein ACXVHB_06205 [Solirubrobacteraceae bacterium]
MSKAIEDFKALPAARRAGVSALLAVALALVFTAERDIQRRPSSEVRGSKLIWRVLCLNAVGAVGYLLWGRRSSP